MITHLLDVLSVMFYESWVLNILHPNLSLKLKGMCTEEPALDARWVFRCLSQMFPWVKPMTSLVKRTQGSGLQIQPTSTPAHLQLCNGIKPHSTSQNALFHQAWPLSLRVPTSVLFIFGYCVALMFLLASWLGCKRKMKEGQAAQSRDEVNEA